MELHPANNTGSSPRNPEGKKRHARNKACRAALVKQIVGWGVLFKVGKALYQARVLSRQNPRSAFWRLLQRLYVYGLFKIPA